MSKTKTFQELFNEMEKDEKLKWLENMKNQVVEKARNFRVQARLPKWRKPHIEREIAKNLELEEYEGYYLPSNFGKEDLQMLKKLIKTLKNDKKNS